MSMYYNIEITSSGHIYESLDDGHYCVGYLTLSGRPTPTSGKDKFTRYKVTKEFAAKLQKRHFVSHFKWPEEQLTKNQQFEDVVIRYNDKPITVK